MATTHAAYLLTRHWRDTPQGVELQFWASSAAGPLLLRYPGQQAVCFVTRDTELPTGGVRPQRKPLEMTDLQGRPVDALYFPQQRQLQQFRERLRGSSTLLLESDIKASDRFLMERFITAPMEVSGNPVERDGYLELTQPRLRPIDYAPELSYLSLDIETDGSANQVLSIAYCGRGREEILMQGTAADWPSELPIHWYSDEAALLRGFLQRFQQLDPDLILGWNLINFDLDHWSGAARPTAYPLPWAVAGSSPPSSSPNRTARHGSPVFRDGWHWTASITCVPRFGHSRVFRSIMWRVNCWDARN